MVFKVIKQTLFLICFYYIPTVFSENITQEIKDKVSELKTLKGVDKVSLVDEAIQRSSTQDISRVNEIINSKSYQDRLNKYHGNVKQVLGLEPLTDIAPVSAEETNIIGDRLVLFVSSSMPIHVLRNYVNDVDKVGGVMIFKGTIGGIDSFIPTVNFLRQLLAKDPNCTAASCDMRQVNISIDPDRFSHHGIKRVPALIFEENMKIPVSYTHLTLPTNREV